MELRDYQHELSAQGVEILRKNKMVYFALAPRVGKTIISLETATLYDAVNILFITKKKAIKSIEKDCSYYPNLLVTVVNYESLHKVVGNFDLIVCDEAHCFGSFPKPSQRAKDVKLIAKGKPIIYLSGSPTPESFSQMYHQMWVSSFPPFHEPNFYKWANSFVNKKQRIINGFTINDYSNAKEESIKKYIGHLFIDYTQKEAGFDVQIQERILTVQLTQLQEQIIDALIKDRVYISQNNGEIVADTAVRLQQLIHQICSGTIKLDESKRVILSDAKAKFIKEYFKGQKIAIFYKFIAEREMLKVVFDNYTESPEYFQTSNDRVFIGQFISSREGVNLSTADAIVFMNIDFSYLSYAQGRERIISKDRQKQAVLYWIFSDDQKRGIEAKIYKVVQKKKDFTSYYFKKSYEI
jgi:hypothetical protein